MEAKRDGKAGPARRLQPAPLCSRGGDCGHRGGQTSSAPGPGNTTPSLFFSAHFTLGWMAAQERPRGRAGLPSLPGFSSPEEAVRGSGRDGGIRVLLWPLRAVGEANHWPNKPSSQAEMTPGVLALCCSPLQSPLLLHPGLKPRMLFLSLQHPGQTSARVDQRPQGPCDSTLSTGAACTGTPPALQPWQGMPGSPAPKPARVHSQRELTPT